MMIRVIGEGRVREMTSDVLTMMIMFIQELDAIYPNTGRWYDSFDT